MSKNREGRNIIFSFAKFMITLITKEKLDFDSISGLLADSNAENNKDKNKGKKKK